MTDDDLLPAGYETGPCGVPWPTDSTTPEPAPPAAPARSSGYAQRCGTCDDPVITDGTLHVWPGRSGLPERPYDHAPTAGTQ